MAALGAGMMLVRIGPATAGSLPAPDYTRSAAWAAYPDQPSHALERPTGVAPGTDSGVAVFFVHPTTYLSTVIGNASFDAGGRVGARIDDAVLRFQASVFNGCCAIFAPRYRQASLRAITSNTPEAYRVDDLAYGDVERAFERFLQVNPGRPFILAGHSQGSIHALRLLEQRIIGTPLAGRMVAAYLVGVALPTAITALGMPICADEHATGCVISWNTVRRGHLDRRRNETAVIWWQNRYQPIAGRPLVCVDPLTWRTDDSAPAAANLGAVYSAGPGAPIPAPVPQLTGASCHDGQLGIDIPWNERRHFRDPLTLLGVYHDFDYGLFYINIRRNAATRALEWVSKHHASAAH